MFNRDILLAFIVLIDFSRSIEEILWFSVWNSLMNLFYLNGKLVFADLKLRKVNLLEIKEH